MAQRGGFCHSKLRHAAGTCDCGRSATDLLPTQPPVSTFKKNWIGSAPKKRQDHNSRYLERCRAYLMRRDRHLKLAKQVWSGASDEFLEASLIDMGLVVRCPDGLLRSAAKVAAGGPTAPSSVQVEQRWNAQASPAADSREGQPPRALDARTPESPGTPRSSCDRAWSTTPGHERSNLEAPAKASSSRPAHPLVEDGLAVVAVNPGSRP